MSEPNPQPRLTVLLGAGASIPVGMPSTERLTDAAFTALSEHSPWSGDQKTFLAGVSELLNAGRVYYGARFNFEHLLDLLESAQALVVGRVPGNAPTTAEVCLTEEARHLVNALERGFLSEATHILLRTILAETTMASSAAQANAEWQSFSGFWSFLGRHFDLTVVTLNYDDLVEQALSLFRGRIHGLGIRTHARAERFV